MLDNISAKNKFIIIALALIFIICLALLAILFYVLPIIQSGASTITEMKNELALLEEKRREVKKVEVVMEEAAPHVKRVRELGVDNANPLNFFEFLYATASSSDVLVDIRLTGAREPSVAGAVEYGVGVNMSIDGPAGGVLNFLNLLETASYLMEIQDLAMGGGETRKAPLRATVNLKAISR